MCPPSRNRGSSVLSDSTLSKINELLPYLERIDWQGGEFFHFKHIKELFSKLKFFPKITHVITTNGLLLDQEWIEILLELNSELIFSIDSPRQETYEYIRNGACYRRLIENLELIKRLEEKHKKELKRQITVVVMRSNCRHLPEFVPFLKKYGFSNINFNPLMFLDNEENILKHPDPEFLDGIKSDIQNELRNSGIGLGWNLPSSRDKIQDNRSLKNATLYCNLPLDTIWKCIVKGFAKIGLTRVSRNNNCVKIGHSSLGRKKLYCFSPWRKLWIDIDRGGNIFPDCPCLYPVGNIYTGSLLEIWNNEKMQQYRKNIIMQDTSLCNKDCVSGYSSKIHQSSQKIE